MKILGRMWRIYRVSAIFFVRRAGAVALPASGTGALTNDTYRVSIKVKTATRGGGRARGGRGKLEVTVP